MALSMLDPIFQKDPEASVTWVCGKTVEPLLRAVGKINELIAVDEKKLLTGGFWERGREVLSVWARLMGKRFDLVVTAHSDPRYRLLSLAAIGKVRRSFGHSGGRAWPVPGRYHGDEYARLITGIDGPDAPRGKMPVLRIPLRPELRGALKTNGKSWMVLAPGGAKNVLREDGLRRWPIENYRRLAELLAEYGYPVVLTGSSSDGWVSDFFKGMEVLDLIGKTSLLDLVALYGECPLVITHDSGPMHLAALAGTPCLALFGPTSPLEKVSGEAKTRVLWGGEQLACRPCYDGKKYADCANNVCLRSVSARKVYEEAVQILMSGETARGTSPSGRSLRQRRAAKKNRTQ